MAETAMAVLAFENNGHYGWETSDPDHSIVQNGLNWLFSNAYVVGSSGDPYGNVFPGTDTAGTCPGATCVDVSGDGYAIGWYGDGYPVYETPMVLMAIVGSNSPNSVATTGPAGVVGLTYKHIAQDIVDWIAWAQNSVAAAGQSEGGWRYYPQSYLTFGPSAGSDNSNSQWPVIGLLAAQLWGLNAPSWVGTELQKWIVTDQDLSGTPATNSYYGAFDYYPGVGLFSPAETAAGILEMTYAGTTTTNANLLAAEGYLYSDWAGGGYYCGWNCNIGSLYNMYSVMKAMKLTMPAPITYIQNYAGTASIQWYNGAGQYADSLIANQGADGHWNNWDDWYENDAVSNNLGTAWGVLILEYFPVINTETSLSCSPSPGTVGVLESCTATVANINEQNTVEPPGTVTFTGTLPPGMPTSCALPGGTGSYMDTCSAQWTPAIGSQGTYSIVASYGGGQAQGQIFTPSQTETPTTLIINAIYYKVTFTQSGLTSLATGTVVTVDGVPVTYSMLPYTISVPGGAKVTFTWATIVLSKPPGLGWALISSSKSSPYTVTSSITILGTYQLTPVSTTPPLPPG